MVLGRQSQKRSDGRACSSGSTARLLETVVFGFNPTDLGDTCAVRAACQPKAGSLTKLRLLIYYRERDCSRLADSIQY